MDRNRYDELLRIIREKVGQCYRCGACLPVCPLFGERDLESSGARGKNAIARALAEGGIDPSKDLLAAVNFCLLCRTCVDTCPNRVETDEAMIHLRRYLSEVAGTGKSKYAAAAFLKKRSAVKLAAGMLSLLRGLGLNSLLPHGIAPDEYTRRHFLAAFAGPAVLAREAPPPVPEVASTAKVAYFRGCGMRMFFPGAEAETIAILKTHGRATLKDNFCCGLPHLAAGRHRDFLALARKNISLYESIDIIVSDCASCSGMLKHIATYFTDDPLWKGRAADFSRKAMDLTEYLVSTGYRPRRKVEASFTYHDPCHLLRSQGIAAQPRELLAAAGDFIEMNNAGACCGGAGSFHMYYPDISAGILEKKRKSIEDTGAAFVVTACPGCLVQLNKAAGKSGNKFRAMHISQVI